MQALGLFFPGMDDVLWSPQLEALLRKAETQGPSKASTASCSSPSRVGTLTSTFDTPATFVSPPGVPRSGKRRFSVTPAVSASKSRRLSASCTPGIAESSKHSHVADPPSMVTTPTSTSFYGTPFIGMACTPSVCGREAPPVRQVPLPASPPLVMLPPAKNVPTYLKDLNEAQATAAAASPDAPLLVLAGPGSGKTFTLQKRIQHIVRSTGCRPSAILGITFTRCAAEELRVRVGRDLGARAAGHMVMGTFHSFAMRLCRAFIEKVPSARRTADFLLAGSSEQESIIIAALRAHEARVAVESMSQAESSTAGATRPRLLGIGTDSDIEGRRKKLARRIIGHITRVRSGDGRAGSSGDSRLLAQLDEQGWPAMSSFLDTYNAALIGANMMDFGELITWANEILSLVPEAEEWVSSRWQYLLVDEFQDTSVSQFKLVRAVGKLLDGRVTVVGDDDQSIYGFQGADISNFSSIKLAFAPVRCVALSYNYRSTPTVVGVCSTLIKGLHTSRLPKQAQPVRADLPPAAVPVRQAAPPEVEDLEASAMASHSAQRQAPSHTVEVMTGRIRIAKCENVQCELEEVYDAIQRFVSKGYTFKDIALLTRRRIIGRALSKALKERGVPVKEAASAVYSRGDVRSAWAVLAAVSNPHNDVALLQALRAMMRGSKRPLSDSLQRALHRAALAPPDTWFQPCTVPRASAVVDLVGDSSQESGTGMQGPALSLYDILSTFSSAPREWRETGHTKDRVPLWLDVRGRLAQLVVQRLRAREGEPLPLHDSSETRKKGRSLEKRCGAAVEECVVGWDGGAALEAACAKARVVWDALRETDLDQFKHRLLKLEGVSENKHATDLTQFVAAAMGCLPNAKGDASFFAARAASAGTARADSWRASTGVRAGPRTGIQAPTRATQAAPLPPQGPSLMDAMCRAADEFGEVWEEEQVALRAAESGDGPPLLATNALAAMTARAEVRGGVLGPQAMADRLQAFVNYVAEHIDGAEYTRDPASAKGSRRGKKKAAQVSTVWVGTVHQAKGLEWPCVIVARVNEGEMPLHPGGNPDLGRDPDPSVLDEERRVAFVALSRAKDHLVATYLHKYLGGQEGRLSHFLSALPPHFVQQVDRHHPSHPARHADGSSTLVQADSVEVPIIQAGADQRQQAIAAAKAKHSPARGQSYLSKFLRGKGKLDAR